MGSPQILLWMEVMERSLGEKDPASTEDTGYPLSIAPNHFKEEEVGWSVCVRESVSVGAR